MLGGMGAGCFGCLGNNPFDVVSMLLKHRYDKSCTCFTDDTLLYLYK